MTGLPDFQLDVITSVPSRQVATFFQSYLLHVCLCCASQLNKCCLCCISCKEINKEILILLLYDVSFECLGVHV